MASSYHNECIQVIVASRLGKLDLDNTVIHKERIFMCDPQHGPKIRKAFSQPDCQSVSQTQSVSQSVNPSFSRCVGLFVGLSVGLFVGMQVSRSLCRSEPKKYHFNSL